MLKKIISGGQTGVDRAALDVAIELGISHGGWIAKGRITEAGPLPHTYDLKEMATPSNEARTEQNVIDSDATLIISRGDLTGGSAFTEAMAKMDNTELPVLDKTLGSYLRNNYGLKRRSGELMKDCRYRAKNRDLGPDQASTLIIEAFWTQVRETHLPRVVK
jgi:hypothetical protein